MKIKITLLSLMAAGVTSVASAQQIENDDMYFNAKDRAKLVAARPVTLKTPAQENLEVKSPINPTDSYSARNVNPEYIAQSKMNPSDESEDAPYFIPDYTPKSVNQNIYSNSSLWNNNYNYATAWNNPYFGMMPGWGWGSPFGSFNPYSNFYRGWYDPFGYSGFNNFYQPGWSWSLGFGTGWNSWGNSWGWGGSPFWNNYYYNNFWGWNSFNNWGGYGYYPNTIVVINNGSDNNGRKAVYGKRVSRSNDLSNTVTYNNRNSGSTAVVDNNGKVRGSGGRVSGGNESGGYYQKGWRTNPAINPTTTTNSWSGSRSSGGNDSWSNTSNSRNNSGSMFQNNSRSSSNWSGGNSSNFSSGGGSRSSGGVSGGGGSSGSRRGRD